MSSNDDDLAFFAAQEATSVRIGGVLPVAVLVVMVLVVAVLLEFPQKPSVRRTVKLRSARRTPRHGAMLMLATVAVGREKKLVFL